MLGSCRWVEDAAERGEKWLYLLLSKEAMQFVFLLLQQLLAATEVWRDIKQYICL